MSAHQPITDQELNELAAASHGRWPGKPVKYKSLDSYRNDIERAIQRDVSLPVLLDWLKANRSVDVSLNTLRKYVIRYLGRDVYDAFLERNDAGRAAIKNRKPRATQYRATPGGRRTTEPAPDQTSTSTSNISSRADREKVADRYVSLGTNPLIKSKGN